MPNLTRTFELIQLLGENVIFQHEDADLPDSTRFIQIQKSDWADLGYPVVVTGTIGGNEAPDDLSSLETGAAPADADVPMDPDFFDDCDTIQDAIAQALGAASTCWSNLSGAGDFLSNRAGSIVPVLQKRLDELLAASERRESSLSSDEERFVAPDGTMLAADPRWGVIAGGEPGPLPMHRIDDLYCNVRAQFDEDARPPLNPLAICRACSAEVQA